LGVKKGQYIDEKYGFLVKYKLQATSMSILLLKIVTNG